MASSQNKKSNGKQSNTRSKSTQSGSAKKGQRSSSNRSRSNTSGRKGSGRSYISQEEKRRNDIILLSVTVICILLEVCLFGVFGIVGEYVRNVVFGMFGAVAYAIPILVGVITYLFIANRNGKRKDVVIRTIYLCLLLLSFSVIWQLIHMSNITSIKDVYDQGVFGGGIIGGGLTLWMDQVLGTIGSYIIAFLVGLVSFILLFNISVIELFNDTVDAFSVGAEKTKEYHQDKEEKRRVRREEERLEEDELEREELAREQMKLKKRREQRTKERAQRMEDLSGEEHLRMMRAKKSVDENREDIKQPKEKKGFSTTKNSFFANTTVLPANDATNTKKDSIKTVPSMTAMEDVHQIHMDEVEFDEVDSVEDTVVTKKVSSRKKVKDDMPKPKSIPEVRQVTSEPKVKAEKTTEQDAKSIREEIHTGRVSGSYHFPPISLLNESKNGNMSKHNQIVNETADRLLETLRLFGVEAKLMDINSGPSVTRYEIQPAQGTKVSKIVGLTDDIKLNLAAEDIRIEAPIPGKAAIGIEIPNKVNSMVSIRELLSADVFTKARSKITFGVGKDLTGDVVVADLAKMPHILIAGQTGSGKSVCINTLIMSILYKASPEDVKLIMIDPKMVELNVYNGIPHLLLPVVTDPKKAAGTLNWAVEEMIKRYKLFSEYNVRNLEGFNQKVEEKNKSLEKDGVELDEPKIEKMPQIVVIVDELADLMMVAHGEVEDAIVRLSQLARAAGIHLVIATQRPSVDVITGLIKANVPSRIAFSVSSGVDSRTILDMVGAEKLLGKGDMLFYPTGYPKPVRLQGAFVSDDEIVSVVDYVINNNDQVEVNEAKISEITSTQSSSASSGSGSSGAGSGGDDKDEYFTDAAKFIIEKDKASIGMLQRVFKIGFNRAARIMDQLCEAGVVGPEEGTKPRTVLMTMEQFDNYLNGDEY